MYYTKIFCGDGHAEIPLSQIPVFTKCPMCGIEQEMAFHELTEIIAEIEPDFDADKSMLICESCAERGRKNG